MLNKKVHLFIFAIVAGLVMVISSTCKNSTNSGLSIGTSSAKMTEKLPEVVDFNYHIRPILSDRCYTCHGPDKSKIEAGLSFLTYEDATIALGDNKDHYAINPENLAESTLLKRIYSDDPTKLMPPPESNLSLSSYEKELLELWIKQGAKYETHWAFLPVTDVAPSEKSKDLYSHPIDQYIHDKLATNQLSFSPRTEKERLIRRLSFDLRGISPSIDEIEEFVASDDADAYRNLVESFLDSDHYAENMTTKWLDLARYADTHGYQDDLERTMWPWRDWVLHAYKSNMPYNTFVTWQLGGDLLPNASKEQIIATAFNRNHSITQEGGVIPEEYRVEYVADRTMTFGKAFLGLTIECARCHDHKYDPISAKDYYSLFSFFNNVPEKGLIEQYGAIPEPYITITNEEIESTLLFINNVDTIPEIPLLIMEEMPEKRQAYILERGGYENHGKKVSPDAPSSILPFAGFSQDRLGLSNWLFDKNNPLTARVSVNRLWKMCFSTGLVKTTDDFGSQGELPTHPELLDHLALYFMNSGWDVKKTLAYIVQSETYQQSSRVNNEMLEIDPENLLYARSSRTRLSAEKIRDHLLKSSGLLVQEVGGPSVKPYQPAGLWKEKVGGGGGTTAEYKMDEGSKRYRKSLYTFWKRTVPPPSMMTFDAISRDLCMVDRETTSTPLQALVMMNNPEVIEASRSLAMNTVAIAEERKRRIETIFYSIVSRKPNEAELRELNEFFSEELQKFMKNPEKADAFLFLDESPVNLITSKEELAAYAMLSYTIYNLDESISKS